MYAPLSFSCFRQLAWVKQSPTAWKNPLGSHAFAVRLRQLRKKRGFSQQKLATEAEIDRSTVKRIELREVTPTLDVLISISRALGLALSELMEDPSIITLDKQ
jgi:DNA-binding XRE family transcriptional regulator